MHLITATKTNKSTGSSGSGGADRSGADGNTLQSNANAINYNNNLQQITKPEMSSGGEQSVQRQRENEVEPKMKSANESKNGKNSLSQLMELTIIIVMITTTLIIINPAKTKQRKH